MLIFSVDICNWLIPEGMRSMIKQNNCEKEGEVLLSRISEHEVRIRDLEISQARIVEKMDGLIDRLDDLTNWIKALALIGLTSLLSTIAWAIQYIIK